MNRTLVMSLLLLTPLFSNADGLSRGPVRKSQGSDVGYRTVAEALASLKSAKGTSFSVVKGWTIVTDEAHRTVWTFSPDTDPSYPSVVKHTLTASGSRPVVTMKVLCESDHASCDNLVREFSSAGSRGGGTKSGH